MGEEMYPFVRSFHEDAFQGAKRQHPDRGNRPKEVSTPEIREEQIPRYKKTSNPFCGCPQSPRNVGSALLSAPRCSRTASRLQHLIDCVIWHWQHLSQLGQRPKQR